ncbi:ABC transporter permease [Thalassoroseus pseudoceratinae]|uniref:ABC transporter permease n=1 Tax=Thalassoroseus pseudoceratinae TaxID=2713176 RepID=UPI00141DB53D|nr:FtsX-like permease family protein [Thalassoroseus pseudoceratinae]
MNLRTLVWRELFERKGQMLTIVVGILLGITTVVAIQNITFYSEKAVAVELDRLGANVLILPKSVSLQDYYAADMHQEVIPEEYVMRLTLSELQGVDNLSPKLCVPVELHGRKYPLTGILPKSEFQAKAAWAGAGIFSRPIGCGALELETENAQEDRKDLVRNRVIKDLAKDEILVGSDLAETQQLMEGESVELLGESFKVIAVLPETGTVDDSRIFAHLHQVQDLTGQGPVVNCIEVVGCCKEISAGLVEGVNELLPDAKVVTIKQVVDTQVKVHHMMERLSLIFVAIIVVVGGAGIANFMFANVSERRREIGTLMAMGAQSRLIQRLFLAKALVLGFAGGVGGFVIGTMLAVTLGPKLAGVPVLPMPMLSLWAIAISVGVALVASYIPARRAAMLDPVTTFREI